jgi:hypothetical protein
MCTTYFISRLQGCMSPRRLATVAIFGAARVRGEGHFGAACTRLTYTLESILGGGALEHLSLFL